MEVSVNKTWEVRVPGLMRLNLTGEETQIVFLSDSATVKTQELLLALESVCDSLRTSLHWRKNSWGYAVHGKAAPASFTACPVTAQTTGGHTEMDGVTIGDVEMDTASAEDVDMQSVETVER